jgi:hypothetical protein
MKKYLYIFNNFVIYFFLLIFIFSYQVFSIEIAEFIPDKGKEIFTSVKGLVSGEKGLGDFSKELVIAASPQVAEIIGNFENLFKGPQNPVMQQLSKIKSQGYQVGSSEEAVIYQSILFKESSIEVLKDYRDELEKISHIIEDSLGEFDFEKIKELFESYFDSFLKSNYEDNTIFLLFDYMLSFTELMKYQASVYKDNIDKVAFFNNKMNDVVLKSRIIFNKENLLNQKKIKDTK